MSLQCGHAACRKALTPPFLQCAKCKAAAYCSKACQVPPPHTNKCRVCLRALTRSSVPARPAPCHQTAAWKAGHKRECAPGKCAAAAALIRRAAKEAARPAPRAQAGLTKEQRRLWTRLGELEAAADWRGIVALETEALALARDLRGAHPEVAGAIHGALGLGFYGVGEYARAIALHEEQKAMAEEIGRASCRETE